MKNKTIYFVTTNKNKYKDYKKRLNSVGWKLKQLANELNELQILDGTEIAKHKLMQAKELLPGKKVIVDDRGFFIPELNDFPGAFVKMILKSIGVDGILKLMVSKKDRTAKFISVLGYFDGKKDHFFIDEEIGFLTKNKRGDNLRGWTELLYIYGYKTFPKKTLAQLTDGEWNIYMDSLAENDFLKKFTEFLSSK